MYVNNPNYTIKLSDLLDLYKDNFNYEDLYEVVGTWLSSEKVYFFKNDGTLWNDFVQAFCDRFYSRSMNFYTTLDFKLKLRDVLRSSKNRATRIYESELLKINQLKTFSHLTDRKENLKGNANSKTNIDDVSKNESKSNVSTNNNSVDIVKNENTSTSYSLHSDTPSNAVNIDDLFSVAKNFVTDADNNKSKTTGTNKTTNEFNGSVENSSSGENKRNSVTNGTNEFLNENLFKEVSEGYNGNPVDLIEQYMQLKTDVVQFYLDEIENACLFSSILY